MSGGSFNYLCWKDPHTDSWEISEQLGYMESSMRAGGYHDIADELFKYKLELDSALHRLEIMHKRLEGVMHAYEWWQSCDYGEGQFKEVVEIFKKGPK